MHSATGNACSPCSCWRKSSSSEDGEKSRKAVKAPWLVSAEAPSLWLLAGAAAGTAPLGLLLGLLSVLAFSRSWILQQGTQAQPLISRKLTKGPSFRTGKAQGTPNTHHRMIQALPSPAKLAPGGIHTGGGVQTHWGSCPG